MKAPASSDDYEAKAATIDTLAELDGWDRAVDLVGGDKGPRRLAAMRRRREIVAMER